MLRNTKKKQCQLIKPDDWVAPDHTGNHGDISKAM